MKIALWGDNKRRTIPATRNSSSKMTKFGIVILGHTQIQKSVSAILPTYCNIKIAKTFFPPLFGVCKNKLSNVSCISLLRRAVRKKRTIHHVLYIKWGLSQAVWCVCLSCEVLMLHFLCSTHYSHFWSLYLFIVVLQYFSVKQMILFVHSTDASKPIRVCTVCKITIGSTKTVHRVWLYSWWGTSLLHGKWQGRRRYVYEHGASTLLTGTTELLLILIVEIKCLYVSVILNDKILSPSDLNCFNTTQILVFFFFF